MNGVNSAGADWLSLKLYINEEIERLRGELERGGGDIQRGEIMALRKLVATVEPQPKTDVDEDNYTMDPQ